jgi:hypothetical protein
MCVNPTNGLVFLEESVPPLIEINVRAKVAAPSTAVDPNLPFLTDADIGSKYITADGKVLKLHSKTDGFYMIEVGGLVRIYQSNGLPLGFNDPTSPLRLVQQQSPWRVGKRYFDNSFRIITVDAVNHGQIIGRNRGNSARVYTSIGASTSMKPPLTLVEVNEAEVKDLVNWLNQGHSLKAVSRRDGSPITVDGVALTVPTPMVVFLMYYEAYNMEKKL